MKWRSAVHMDDGAGLPTSAYEWNMYVLLCVCMCLSMVFIPLYFLFMIQPLYTINHTIILLAIFVH